jgi:hypothetical protein
MANKVINTAFIESIVNGGKSVNLKYATKTDTWSRPFLAQSVKEDFSKAMKKADIPATATTAILALVICSESPIDG